MYGQFTAWSAKGCTAAPVTDYVNDEIHRELPGLKNIYDSSKSDERLYIDLRRSQGYKKLIKMIQI